MIRLLPSVNAHVALERLQVAEVRAADLAGVRLLSGVDEHVGSQVGHLVGGTAMPITKKNSQHRQLNGVGLDEFPNCVCVFFLAAPLTWTNLEPHVSHLYGFSPEWMRVCVLRLAGRLNWAPQMLQW